MRATPEALLALVIWVAAAMGFKLYLVYFDSYARTYGSLGAIIVLLIWLYLSGIAILIGGEVNSTILAALEQPNEASMVGAH